MSFYLPPTPQRGLGGQQRHPQTRSPANESRTPPKKLSDAERDARGAAANCSARTGGHQWSPQDPSAPLLTPPHPSVPQPPPCPPAPSDRALAAAAGSPPPLRRARGGRCEQRGRRGAAPPSLPPLPPFSFSLPPLLPSARPKRRPGPARLPPSGKTDGRTDREGQAGTQPLQGCTTSPNNPRAVPFERRENYPGRLFGRSWVDCSARGAKPCPDRQTSRAPASAPLGWGRTSRLFCCRVLTRN